MTANTDYWKQCSSCRKPISYRTKYWTCNVSTCNRKPLNMVFCAVPCWDAHLPIMRHRDSWAEEKMSPSYEQWQRELAQEANEQSGKRRRRVPAATPPQGDAPREVLIVASRLKQYVKERADMNTAGNVMDRLSDLVRELCTEAIRNAAMDERKTIMDRDFPTTLRNRDL